MPRQDGVDGLTKHGERRLEGQRVPQERPEQIVAHGEELWQHALPHGPGEDSVPMGKVFPPGPVGPLHGEHVAVERRDRGGD